MGSTVSKHFLDFLNIYKVPNFVCSSIVSLRFVLSRVCVFLYTWVFQNGPASPSYEPHRVY